MITALQRMRQSAKLAAKVPGISGKIQSGISEFERAIPSHTKMRNVSEHIDEYAMDNGKSHKDVRRRQLQVGSWSETTFNFNWLGHELNIDDALKAAENLFQTVIESGKDLRSS